MDRTWYLGLGFYGSQPISDEQQSAHLLGFLVLRRAVAVGLLLVLALPACAALLLRGGAAGSLLAMPSGAIGIWYMDQYQSSPRKAVPNSLSVQPVSQNILTAPERFFSNNNTPQYWSASGDTVTDRAATCSDGTTSAATSVASANTWSLLSTSVTLPAGTFTVAADVKRNTGSDQTFTLYNNGTKSTNQTATSSWQRFAFSHASGSGAAQFGLSNDGSTSANLQVCDIQVFAGASDLGAETLSGHLYLGTGNYDDLPTIGTGNLDFTSAGSSLLQFATPTAYSAFTSLAVISIPSASPASDGRVSVANNTGSGNAFQSWTFLNSKLEFRYNTTDVTFQNANIWQPQLTSGYFAFVQITDGTKATVSVNDAAEFASNATALGSQTLSDFQVGDLLTGKISALAMWPRALSDVEIRQAYNYLLSRLTSAPLSGGTTRYLTALGDSITVNADYIMPAVTHFSPVLFMSDRGVAGYKLVDLENNLSTYLAVVPSPIPAGEKYVFSILIGANDQASYGGSASTFATHLATLCDNIRATGAKVVLITILPQANTAGFNTWRNAANTIIRGWAPGLHYDALDDFGDTGTVMGEDNSQNDHPTDWADGIHPNAAGGALLAPEYYPGVNSI
jgi:hypothetical protein